jgi:hypothetical protein
VNKYITLARKIIGYKKISLNHLRRYDITKGDYDMLKDAVSFLRKRFKSKSESWILRAIVRAFYVQEIGNNRWLVRGIEEFGDQYGVYRVTYYEVSKKYACTCFQTRYGHVRKRRICTHIAAVMLYRRWRGDLRYHIPNK